MAITAGAWTGTGITSSAAQANSGSFALGYADAADPGNPAGLPAGEVEIVYTLLGDANLDGAVNGSDFAIMASNFNKADLAGHSGWNEGDFNYDGATNGADFASLAANFNKGTTLPSDTGGMWIRLPRQMDCSPAFRSRQRWDCSPSAA